MLKSDRRSLIVDWRKAAW